MSAWTQQEQIDELRGKLHLKGNFDPSSKSVLVFKIHFKYISTFLESISLKTDINIFCVLKFKPRSLII